MNQSGDQDMTKHLSFELIREHDIPEIDSRARLYRHLKTGAEVLSLINDDENKSFGIAFKTPPADSTGIAHILEHSVLCGSRKYPLKEPFVELLKGSLHTFLNAMTFPDKTAYPVASQNLTDFYNLVDVYLDSVFFPRLSEDTFRQEGWHYELDDPDAPLEFKGVVFNEMKGAYSSAERRLDDLSQRSLFPETTYGFSSGGDPRVMPDLTYADFKAFHERLYHPSNARAFFYGDDDPDERLNILDAYFSQFDARDPEAGIALQPRFAEPRHVADTYPASAEETEGPARDGMVTVNWMFEEPEDTMGHLALAVLDYILWGTPAAPLRKALTDSGLGEGLLGGGISDILLQPTASFGLKGVDPARTGEVEALVLETLSRLANEGIKTETVAAALNTAEFQLRENNTGAFPRGLSLMFRALRPWLHGKDPLAPLMFAGPFETLKLELEKQRLFEPMIRRLFLDNPHRTTVVLTADPDQAAREATAERARLDAARAQMDDDALNRTIEVTRTLRAQQEAADPPELLAKVPGLALSDLPRTERPIPRETDEVGGVPVIRHELATNGILYVDLGFDLHALDRELLEYVPLFSAALFQTGTGREDSVALSERIGRETGGIRPQKMIAATREGGRSSAWLFVRAKAMPEHADNLLAILKEVLSDARLDNKERIRQMVLEEKAGFEGRLSGIGHHLVDLRLRAGFGEANRLAEEMDGISHLYFLRRLAKLIDSDWEAVHAALVRIRDTLIGRGAMLVNVTTDSAIWGRFAPKLGTFLADLPKGGAGGGEWTFGAAPGNEGLTFPAQVNYVGKGADLRALGYTPGGAAAAAIKWLNTSYLWDRIRVQGGAYGGFARFNPFSGGFTFLSYRDPNLTRTLDAFDGAGTYLGTEAANADFTRAIIGGISDIDRYMLPDAKGFTSLLRHLTGDTEEVRQTRRDELLAAGPADFRALGEALEEVARSGRTVVMGSDTAIGAANAERNGFLDVTKLL